MQPPLISVEHLQKFYPVSKGLFSRTLNFVHAVDDVSFQIGQGNSLGLVGESGCGKTTTAKLLAKLIEPTWSHLSRIEWQSNGCRATPGKGDARISSPRADDFPRPVRIDEPASHNL